MFYIFLFVYMQIFDVFISCNEVIRIKKLYYCVIVKEGPLESEIGKDYIRHKWDPSDQWKMQQKGIQGNKEEIKTWKCFMQNCGLSEDLVIPCLENGCRHASMQAYIHQPVGNATWVYQGHEGTM